MPQPLEYANASGVSDSVFAKDVAHGGREGIGHQSATVYVGRSSPRGRRWLLLFSRCKTLAPNAPVPRAPPCNQYKRSLHRARSISPALSYTQSPRSSHTHTKDPNPEDPYPTSPIQTSPRKYSQSLFALLGGVRKAPTLPPASEPLIQQPDHTPVFTRLLSTRRGHPLAACHALDLVLHSLSTLHCVSLCPCLLFTRRTS